MAWGRRAAPSITALDGGAIAVYAKEEEIRLAASHDAPQTPLRWATVSREAVVAVYANWLRREGPELDSNYASLPPLPKAVISEDKTVAVAPLAPEDADAVLAHDLMRWASCGSQSGGGTAEEPPSVEDFNAAARAFVQSHSELMPGASRMIALPRGFFIARVRYAAQKLPSRVDGLRCDRHFLEMDLLVRVSDALDADGPPVPLLVVNVGRASPVLLGDGASDDAALAWLATAYAKGMMDVSSSVRMLRLGELLDWAETTLAAIGRATLAETAQLFVCPLEAASVDIPQGFRSMDDSVMAMPAPAELGAIDNVIFLPVANFQGAVFYLTGDLRAPEAHFATLDQDSRLKFLYPSFHWGPPPLTAPFAGSVLAPREDGVGVQRLHFSFRLDEDPPAMAYKGVTMLDHLCDCKIAGSLRLADADVAVVVGSSEGQSQAFLVNGDGHVAPVVLPDGFVLAQVARTADSDDLLAVSTDGAFHIVPAEQIAEASFAPVSLPESVVQDMSFAAYEPSCGKDSDLAKAAFDIGKPGSQFAFPDSRAEHIFSRRKGTKGPRFWIVAGLGQVPEEHKAPHYRQLSQTGDLGDFLGAPLWLARPEGPEVVLDACFGDLMGCRRSSNALQSLVEDGCASNDVKLTIEGSEAPPFAFNKFLYVGVIDVRPDTSAENVTTMPDGMSDAPTLTELNTYHVPLADAAAMAERPFFRIESGDLLATDPAYSDADDGILVENAAKGKWYARTVRSSSGETAQLIAVHESVADDASFGGECKLPWSVVDARRSAEAAGSDRPKRARDVPKVQHLRKQGKQAEPNAWIEGNEPLPDGWLPHVHGVGVDTASAGFFDAAHFHDTSSLPPMPQGGTFARDAGGTISSDRWGALVFTSMEVNGFDLTPLPHGIASSSGYGDGCYSLHLQKRDDVIVAARIVFLWPDE